MKKQILLTGFISSGLTLAAFLTINGSLNNPQNITETKSELPVRQVQYKSKGTPSNVNFEGAAASTVNAVVHIKTTSKKKGGYAYNPLGEFFYGKPYQKRPDQIVSGAGSGVIISSDGYIATNYHVIKGAKEISVTLNDKRQLSATIVGKDPNTDLALLKVDEEDLPNIKYGNSDHLGVGEWVLAVGNPFNLTSTVTAGIVSAKGRDINILKEQYAIESFIQTDAAVNPGNSGGALVNSAGELVGINTAIASNTGSYTGYSFAVPVNVVKKVMHDLKEYGQVQRALLGVQIQAVDNKIAKNNEAKSLEGAYVARVFEGTAASEAGVKNGDIIKSINNNAVISPSQLLEQIGQYGPGDEIKVQVLRKGKLQSFNVVLKNKNGSTAKAKKSPLFLGAEFSTPSNMELQKLDINSGVKISTLTNGKLAKEGIKEGFIITHINNEVITSSEQAMKILKSRKGGILIEGIYPDGQKAYYGFGMN